MEKEMPESMATVTIKPDYAPSEAYSSEPPPAYMKPKSVSVQVAKIVAVTVVLCSVVLGSFLLASAYVTANASCRQLEQELELLREVSDRYQSSQPLQPEALIAEQPISKSQSEPLQTEESKKSTKEIVNNNIDNDDNSLESSDSSDESDNSYENNDDEKIRFKLPLQLDFDDLAGALIDRNQKSRMNCVVEKKRAEELVDHQSKTVRLPFGVNLTTDPRLERISGERMAIFCESGHFQSAQPQPQPQTNEDNDDEDEQDTIMIQPVMIPIPHSHYPTHMPQQMASMPQQQQPQIQFIHPMETMKPPMPPMMQQQNQIPQQNQMPPNPVIQHIIQQIIAQKIMESQRAQVEQQNQESSQAEVERMPPRMQTEGMMGRLPIPEEVLSQLNRLPNREGIVVVSEQEPEDNPQELQVIQHQRTSPEGMNGRQTYARGLPVDIPVPMMQQEQEQEQKAAPSEETRPHYVQPRSVRSVDALLPKNTKRVKRCACDCSC
ncbi:unnamed protein product [Brassicogethes aeneus]|uniref:Uncharacterized protein n=1 Tax=Brassicogethes aeneus TaxID=1431903 RepID=A0A9P0FBD8_BRAAE|nr:unnamed protein product [Brassicogethes aeneus]